MKLISPTLNIDQEATPRLVEKVVKKLVGRDYPFLILEKTEMTYMQSLWTENGYIIEYQEDDILHHYINAGFIAQDDAIWTLLSYLKGQHYWKNRHEFVKKDIDTISSESGDSLGSKLRWVSFSSSKNLHLVDLTELDGAKYHRILDQFIRGSESINKRADRGLLYQLETFPKRGILYSHKYEDSERFHRSGYFNLYRWCTTEHYAAQEVAPFAIKLWKFLFLTLPSGLVDYCDNFLLVYEPVWKTWYRQLSRDVTAKEKIMTAGKAFFRQFK